MKLIKRCALCHKRIWWWQDTRKGAHIDCAIQKLKEDIKQLLKDKYGD